MKNISSEAELMRSYNPSDYSSKLELISYLHKSPIPTNELQHNLLLFQDRRVISRILFVNEMYQRILSVHGSIFEFGVRYGSNMALFTSLRGIYEPFNHNRKVVGFDTFEGFPHVSPQNDTAAVHPGDYAVPEKYELFLAEILNIHEKLAPVESIRKYELVKGDAAVTIHDYLRKHQETVVALAYFDLDVYQPTKVCLESILPYLAKGAIIGFDELNVPEWPGEAIALREILSTGKFRLYHSPFRAAAAYLIYE